MFTEFLQVLTKQVTAASVMSVAVSYAQVGLLLFVALAALRFALVWNKHQWAVFGLEAPRLCIPPFFPVASKSFLSSSVET